METLEKFRAVNRNFPDNSYIKDWKAAGKKVVGWLCIYVPEEVIAAGGMLPVRITGTDAGELSLDKANVYVAESTCSFIRNCLELGLRGQYDYLDGLAVSVVCQGCTRLSEVWEYYITNVPVIYTLDLPRNITQEVVDFYRDEILDFKGALEKAFGVKITDEKLLGAIKVSNETRRLMKGLYEARKAVEPEISGAEVLEVLNASNRMPKVEFNGLLGKLFQEMKGRKAYSSGSGTRVMLVGSPLNSVGFLKDLENLGFSVVIDELCTGGKYAFSGLVDEDGKDPVGALSKHYINQFPCPREMPKELRFKRIVELAKEYQVKGAIALTIRYCNNVVWSQPNLSADLEKVGVPTFVLDMDYGEPITGQIRTRLEAFLESIEGI